MGFLMSTLIASSLLAASDASLSWTPETLLNMKNISDVQISPDHQSLLFVVTEPKITSETGINVSRIYLAKDESPIPFSAADISSSQPRWSPNGQWIAFVSKREGKRDLYLIRSEGGEAIRLTHGKKDVQIFSWSPDGTKIAFVMADEVEEGKKTSLAYEYMQPKSANRLWVMDVFASEPVVKALTGFEYCVRGSGDFGTTPNEFDWSPDSRTIAFGHSPMAGFDSCYLDCSIATVDVATGIISPWEKKSRYEATPRFSPDGRSIAYVSSDAAEKYSISRQLAIRSADGKNWNLLAKTPEEGCFLAGANLLGWSQDGNNLLFFEPCGTKFHLVLVPADGGEAKELDTRGIFFKDPSLSYDRSFIGFVAQTTATPPEAFSARLDDFAPIQASHLNGALLSYPKIATDRIFWKSKDGLKIEGLLTYPIGYQKGKRYPLLLVIHGGPMGFFDETFVGTPSPYPLASFAEAGFLILRANPRGSCGYGKDFRCANYNDWGGMDFIDIQTGVDALIEQGIADSEKMGVMGWSYGGYMTAWTITQTKRFKAASMGAGLSNLISMNGTTDLYRFMTDYLGNFRDHRKLYEERSPINHVWSVTTPCLIQHGTEDKRVPISQAYEFYHALEREGKKSSLVVYPGMEHRLFDPTMQLDAMKRNLAWFRDHVLDSKTF